MTVRDYFISKFQKLSINLPEVQLNLMLASGDFSGTETFNSINKEKLDKIFLENVYDLLIVPDVSEGDLSINFDRDAILKWYSGECIRLGVPNHIHLLDNEVKDLSFLA